MAAPTACALPIAVVRSSDRPHIRNAYPNMLIARWPVLACVVFSATCPRFVTAQSSADSSMTVAPPIPPVAAWGSLALGTGSVGSDGANQLAGIVKANLSVGPVVISYRSSDVGPFMVSGDGVRENALLGGVRTSGHRVFGSAALGFAQASHYHQCEDCGVTDVSPPIGAMAYDVTAHANLLVVGVAMSLAGVAGPPRARYFAVTVGLEVGWFGR